MKFIQMVKTRISNTPEWNNGQAFFVVVVIVVVVVVVVVEQDWQVLVRIECNYGFAVPLYRIKV